jgi:HAD superfamily hydrolase (TIGR01549 family)
MPSPAAILLDLDNTVYAYEPAHRAGLAAAHHVARSFHPKVMSFVRFCDEYDRAREFAKRHVTGQAAVHCRFLYFKVFVENLFGMTMTKETFEVHNAYWAGYDRAMIADANCKATLVEWQRRKIPTAFVTNYTTERQFKKLKQLGLMNLVDYVVTSEEAGAEKPDPTIVRLALERLKVPASKDVHLIGDSVTDDGGVANALGLSFVWMRRGGPDKPNDATAVVDDWTATGQLFSTVLTAESSAHRPPA